MVTDWSGITRDEGGRVRRSGRNEVAGDRELRSVSYILGGDIGLAPASSLVAEIFSGRIIGLSPDGCAEAAGASVTMLEILDRAALRLGLRQT